MVPPKEKPVGHSQAYKPKARENVHDGQVESFRSFWMKVDADIVNNNALSLDERLRFLRDAVASDDVDLVVGLNIDEIKEFLMKKYNSAIAIRQLMIEKIRGLAIHSEYELNGLKKLSVTAEKLYLAVNFCDEKDALLPELFDLIYNQLPRNLGMSMLKKCSPKDMAKVNAFFEGKIELLVNSSLSYKPHLNQKSPMSSSKSTAYKAKETVSKKEDTSQKKEEPVCHFCHQPGHFLRECKDLAVHECKRCGTKGHSAKFCVSKDNKKSSMYVRSTQPVKLDRSNAKDWRKPNEPNLTVHKEKPPKSNSNDTKDNRFIFDAEVDGQKMSLLLDTGAKVNILPVSKCPIASDVPTHQFGTADASTNFTVRGPVEKVLTTTDGTNLPISTYVGNSPIPLIGRDFINLYDVKWNEQGLSGQVDGKPFYLKEEPSIEEMMNDVQDNILLVMPEDLDEESEPPSEMICTSDRLAKLVSDSSDLTEGLGHTNVVKHYIPIKPDTPPICRPERRFPIALRTRSRSQIKEMLQMDVITLSKSEYCFQVRPVAKKDGEIRLCIDYRPLNEITVLDAYPMPRVDETIEKLAGASIFSKIDLTKGYYQMEINEADRHKTAFRFDGQLYEFKRMPFGLASAPQSFMRLMNQVLGHFPFVAIYLDDVTIFSKSIDEHLDHVMQVFGRLREAELKINKNKCEFGVKAINFLGFKIENNCRRPSDEKTEAMNNFPKPSTTQDVHRFIGLTNYFRSLIPNFAQIASPLYELLKPKAKFEWKQRHEKAFIEFKEKMTSQPVVRLPDLEKPFIVKTDACETGMGAVLLQEENGTRHIIEYASKRFNATQMRYPIIEKEATAIMWALGKWKPYLWATRFKIETDHRPLAWLKSKTDCDGKLGNMARRLLEFQRFDIEYIPGKSNEDADAMSRIIAMVTTEDDKDEAINDNALTEHPEWFMVDSNGVTFYIADGNKRRWVPVNKRKEVLEETHDRNCHIGIDRTLSLLRSRVFWPGWSKDVKRHIKQCHTCATTKQTPIETAELSPVETAEIEMLDQWSMDIVGPLPETSSGNKYIIAAQERVSKWPEAASVKSTDADAVIKWLDEYVIKRFGVPKQLTTDRGPQFESRLFRNFLEQMNINHRLGAPYHHQSNGLAERFNRSLEQLMRAGPGEEDGRWDEDLPRALAAYRTSKHAVTGVSPFEALIGLPPRLELDTKLDTIAPVTNTKTETRRIIKDQLVRAERRMKTTYDRRCKAQSARDLDGLRVYWRVPVRKNKLERTYKGPFIAQKTANPLNYIIKGNGRVTKTVHVNQLKLCNNDDAPLDTLRDRGRPVSSAGVWQAGEVPVVSARKLPGKHDNVLACLDFPSL